MGQDDILTRRSVQPAAPQDRKGHSQVITASRGTQQRGKQMNLPDNSLVLSGTGQTIPFRNVQAVGRGGNRVVQKALRSDTNWGVYSDNNLPIPAFGGCDPTISEQDFHAVPDSITTLPLNMVQQNTLPITPSVTVLESPMLTTSPALPAMSQPLIQSQQQQQQMEDASYQTEPASLEDLMYEEEDMVCDLEGAMATDASGVPPFNHCPTGTGSGSSNGNTSGGSQAESGNGGQSHYVTGYSLRNCGSSMVTGGNGGGGLGGGGDDDPSKNNRHLQRSHYAEGNVFEDVETEDFARIIDDQLEELCGQNMPFIPNLQTSEIFHEGDSLPGGNTAGTPGDNMMAYYSKFDSSGGGLQPMEESSDLAPPLPRMPSQKSVPITPVPATSIAIPVSDSISSSFDMIKLMKKQRKPPPVNNRPSELNFQPPSPASSYISAPSPATSMPPPTPHTPQLSYPVQVSTPQRQQQILPPRPRQQRERSMPPPSPAPPPTPANVRPFDCRRFEENGKIYLELLVRKDLPADELQFTLKCFYHSVQFCMDIGEIMRDPCDLKVSNHVCATVADFRFDSEQSKLVFSIPADCKHVNQWLAEKGMEATFLDRSAVLQQVLNTLATIHNNGRDKSLWGAFQVFVAPNRRVYVVPDILPMLCKMQAVVGDNSFNPRFDDSRAVWELYERLIPPTINQNSSWISPGVEQLLHAFKQLVQDPSSIFKMAEIARTLGEKMMCRMDVDYLGLATFNIFCVEHELVLTALSSIQSMVPEGATIVWVPSFQPVAIQDLATAVRPMRLGVSYSSSFASFS